MRAFFEGIQDLFVNGLFWPFDFLRFLENWWVANTVNWIFFAICSVAFVYWMLQLKKSNDNNEEDKSITSHSYL
jgi:cbb3-type cytochrome oxidase subunit 3